MASCMLFLLGLTGASAFAGAAVRGSAPAVRPAAASVQMGVPVVDFDAATVGEEEVALKVAKSGAYVVHRKVVAEQANMRLGTACTKTRSDVRGGGRKPYQQKGTGNARRGSTRSPLIVGGGVTFGPKPKNWANKKMNKKEARLAVSLAFQSRAPSMTVVKGLETSLSVPKTAAMSDLLSTLGIGPSDHL